MKTKAVLQAADVNTVIQAALQEAQSNNWAVTIAVVDDGGNLLGLTRMDGCPPVSAHIAPGKAVTSAMGWRESGAYEKVVNDGRFSFLSVGVLPAVLEGGAPIMVDGQCIGAVGVSGVKSNEDLQIAKAGIAALKIG
jgi:glc operon protein GlcG